MPFYSNSKVENKKIFFIFHCFFTNFRNFCAQIWLHLSRVSSWKLDVKLYYKDSFGTSGFHIKNEGERERNHGNEWKLYAYISHTLFHSLPRDTRPPIGRFLLYTRAYPKIHQCINIFFFSRLNSRRWERRREKNSFSLFALFSYISDGRELPSFLKKKTIIIILTKKRIVRRVCWSPLKRENFFRKKAPTTRRFDDARKSFYFILLAKKGGGRERERETA